MLRNQDIRLAAKSAGVHLWEIAEELGISSAWFTVVLRKELRPEKKNEMLAIIEKLASQKEAC